MNENRALTQEEELRLLAAVRNFNKPFMFIVVVALYTGCRKGEFFALKWRHIDFENRTIKIDSQLIREYTPFIEAETKTVYQPKNPKTKNSKRLIHMIEPLAAEFMVYKLLRTPNCPFVLFVGTKKLVKRKEFEQFISETLILK